jgi:hypothetical protein
VFPARYELNSYIVFRKRLVSKRLKNYVEKEDFLCRIIYRPQDLTCNRRQKSECYKLSPAQRNCMGRTTETDCIFVCVPERQL